MLHVGRNKCIDNGELKGLSWCQCDAETLPYPDEAFDRVVIGFGLRNVTDKALPSEMHRILKPGGKALFSNFQTSLCTTLPTLRHLQFFSTASFRPFFAQDKESYQYLAESIRKHPDQDALAEMMREADFESVTTQI